MGWLRQRCEAASYSELSVRSGWIKEDDLMESCAINRTTSFRTHRYRNLSQRIRLYDFLESSRRLHLRGNLFRRCMRLPCQDKVASFHTQSMRTWGKDNLCNQSIADYCWRWWRIHRQTWLEWEGNKNESESTILWSCPRSNWIPRWSLKPGGNRQRLSLQSQEQRFQPNAALWESYSSSDELLVYSRNIW